MTNQKMDHVGFITEADWIKSHADLTGHVTPQDQTIDTELLRKLYHQVRLAHIMTKD
jgi:hypothetical protein